MTLKKHQENSTALQLLVKMRGFLFLLCALFLLESTKGTEYDQLNDHDRNIVDKAIAQANKDHGRGKHLDFYTIVQRNKNMVNVILRPTSCDSTTPSVHRKECETHKNPPQVSCINCDGIMKPCLLLRQTKEIQKRMNECQTHLSVNSHDSHLTAASHLLFQIGENEQQQTGCLGCI